VEGVIAQTVAKLKETGSVLYPGFMRPEGVVVTFKEMKSCKWKRLCENDKLHKHLWGKHKNETN
jgi:hypothetical protein